jgi:hypothetical protein
MAIRSFHARRNALLALDNADHSLLDFRRDWVQPPYHFLVSAHFKRLPGITSQVHIPRELRTPVMHGQKKLGAGNRRPSLSYNRRRAAREICSKKIVLLGPALGGAKNFGAE